QTAHIKRVSQTFSERAQGGDDANSSPVLFWTVSLRCYLVLEPFGEGIHVIVTRPRIGAFYPEWCARACGRRQLARGQGCKIGIGATRNVRRRTSGDHS